MSWISISIAGVITYLTRMTMITIISRDMLNDKIKLSMPSGIIVIIRP